ncbi:MAG: hypothetical protein HKN62_08555 [Phycisphaerales bacterium]|nr:hypothetical protein [Phycisphaerales bacterium]
MQPVIPVAVRLEAGGGRVADLPDDFAAPLYFANRSTVETKRLRTVGGRTEFERDRQMKILRWLSDRERPGRPRVLLIGDSIRMRQADTTGYGLHAYRALVNDYNLSHISHNTENSGLVRELIDDWLQCAPDVVHYNAGLHDLSRHPRTDVLPPWHHPVDRYQDNLRFVIGRMREHGVRTIVWASSTPVHDGWHDVDVRTGRPRGVRRKNADVIRYNAAAAEVMAAEGVPINDLYARVMDEGVERCLVPDGVHLSHHGSAILGAQVAETITRLHPPRPEHAATPGKHDGSTT